MHAIAEAVGDETEKAERNSRKSTFPRGNGHIPPVAEPGTMESQGSGRPKNAMNCEGCNQIPETRSTVRLSRPRGASHRVAHGGKKGSVRR
jgi:hypothetical protein